MKKNALMTMVGALLLLCGCATERHITDAKHPDIAITPDGGVTYRGKYVDPEDLPGLLRRSGFTREDTINIHYPDGQNDYRTPSRVMNILLHNGYPRSVLVGDRKSYSHVGKEEKKRPPTRDVRNAPPRIRYK